MLLQKLVASESSGFWVIVCADRYYCGRLNRQTGMGCLVLSAPARLTGEKKVPRRLRFFRKYLLLVRTLPVVIPVMPSLPAASADGLVVVHWCCCGGCLLRMLHAVTGATCCCVVICCALLRCLGADAGVTVAPLASVTHHHSSPRPPEMLSVAPWSPPRLDVLLFSFEYVRTYIFSFLFIYHVCGDKVNCLHNVA